MTSSNSFSSPLSRRGPSLGSRGRFLQVGAQVRSPWLRQCARDPAWGTVAAGLGFCVMRSARMRRVSSLRALPSARASAAPHVAPAATVPAACLVSRPASCPLSLLHVLLRFAVSSRSSACGIECDPPGTACRLRLVPCQWVASALQTAPRKISRRGVSAAFQRRAGSKMQDTVLSAENCFASSPSYVCARVSCSIEVQTWVARSRWRRGACVCLCVWGAGGSML